MWKLSLFVFFSGHAGLDRLPGQAGALKDSGGHRSAPPAESLCQQKPAALACRSGRSAQPLHHQPLSGICSLAATAESLCQQPAALACRSGRSAQPLHYLATVRNLQLPPPSADSGRHLQPNTKLEPLTAACGYCLHLSLVE